MFHSTVDVSSMLLESPWRTEIMLGILECLCYWYHYHLLFVVDDDE